MHTILELIINLIDLVQNLLLLYIILMVFLSLGFLRNAPFFVNRVIEILHNMFDPILWRIRRKTKLDLGIDISVLILYCSLYLVKGLMIEYLL